MSLRVLWDEMEKRAARDVGIALRNRGWVLTGHKGYWSAAPNETRPDLGRIELAIVRAPWNAHLDDEVTACGPEQLLERIESVEQAAKAAKRCCEGECPECTADEEELP